MRVAIYARVSTTEQNVGMQIEELKNYCNRMQYLIYDEYVDVGVSGAKQSRPQFNELLSDMRKKKFDAILVWKLDRIGRSLQHLLHIMQELQHKAIGFISYNQNIDTTTPSGKLLFQIIGAFAEFEREIIRERVKAGKTKSKLKQGRKPLRINKSEVLRLRNEGKAFER
jgi:DNA invertase Pin-like site-specific DNA recombinase